jgi:hypothetical protein
VAAVVLEQLAELEMQVLAAGVVPGCNPVSLAYLHIMLAGAAVVGQLPAGLVDQV